MTKKIFVIPTDPIKVFYDKGEIKERYYNPGNFFDEVHIISFCDKDIDEQKISNIAGNAKLYIHSVGAINLVSIFSIEKRLYELIKKIKPDMLRAYDPSLKGYLAARIGKRAYIPVVVSVHIDFDDVRKYSNNFFKRIGLLLEHYSLRNATEVICVTNYVAEYVRRLINRNVNIIYNKVYSEQFVGAIRGDHENKSRTILCVGRMVKQKRQEILIKAIKDLKVRLILIGNGHLRHRLERLARRLKIEDKVDFVGSVPNYQIQAYYLKADIFAIATDYEGFCIPVLEAMAAGLPIVASGIPPIMEVAGNNGIFVRNNATDFKNAFERLLDSPDMLLEKGRLARERALKLDGNEMEKKEVLLYKRVLSGKTVNA